MHYVALIHTDDTAGFGISFPDFPGCVTQGETLDDALRLAREALAFHVEGIIEDGETIPTARSAQIIETDPEIADWREGATLAYVPLILDMGSAKRVNISIDSGLLEAIDATAKSRGMNRSAFLSSAARKEIAGSW
ncbi:MAG: type II toxin-antitoxin system HicB family antitoxin [Pseudomonadota bacterium]